MNAKKVFLVFKKNDYFYRFCNDEWLQCKQMFSSNKIMFFVAVVFKKMGITIPRFLLGDWIKNIKDYEVIVFTDYAYISGINKYIKKHNNKCRICFYYMNDVEVEGEIYNYLKIDNIKNVFDKNNVYTYSKSDSIKYDICYKPTMYKLSSEFDINSNLNTDIIYLGADKNRGKDIEEIYSTLSDFLNLNFKIFGNNSSIGIKKKQDYQQYLYELWNSKAVLEIVSKEKAAVSLRVLEALFYNKKLITNNKKMMTLEIYNCIKENVYFINCDNICINDICAFLEKDIKDCSTYKEQYDFEKCLNEF